jgi:ribosomal protein S18 acetylase RimI-like enzyme
VSITVREARPEDAAEVIPLMYESSRNLMNYSFRFPDEEPTRFLFRDYLRGRGIFGYENQIVAVDGERVVGTMTVYAGGRATELTLQTIRTAFRHWSFGRFLAFLGRSIAIAPLFIKPRRDGVFLANACVAEEYRGRGLFSRLLSHSVEAYRASAGLVELDVSFSNASAQRIYEHQGFRVTAERPYRGRQPLEGFRRMQRAIES